MLAFVVLALLCACRLTGTIGRDDPNGGGSGGGTMAASESGDGSGTEGEVGGSAEGEGTAVGSESTGSTSAASSSSDTTGDVPHACVPTPDDTECSTCRKTNCCEPLETCLAHEVCTCWWDCLVMHTQEQCEMACGADSSLYDALQTCTHGHCDACT